MLVSQATGLVLGENKINELARLAYEISRRESVTPADILKSHPVGAILKNRDITNPKKFYHIKKELIKRRFPVLSKEDLSFSVPLGRLRIYPKVKTAPNKKFYPRNIFVEKKVKPYEFTERFIEFFPKAKIHFINSIKDYNAAQQNAIFRSWKSDVVIYKERWDFLKRCPCAKGSRGCNYYILNLGFGCPHDCSYCFLQHYANARAIMLPANIDDYLDKFDKYYKKNKDIKRIGTGEFSDSLALDEFTHYSKRLIPFFATKDVLFELKTKSNNIKNLIGLRHNKKTVVSWSLNPQTIIDNEELGTTSLYKRLLAARACQDDGYMVGFHFDPIINFKGWRKDYKKVIDEVFGIANGNIAWISLGTLRFNPTLKPIIERRFPESPIIYGELIYGEDGKLRYHPAQRIAIYQDMISCIREKDAKVHIYLCMETNEIWKAVLKGSDYRYNPAFS